jgi:hypothetical protein
VSVIMVVMMINCDGNYGGNYGEGGNCHVDHVSCTSSLGTFRVL